MKKISYFIQYVLILILFSIFKILGIKLSLIISSSIFSLLGPIIKKNKISKQNLSYVFKNISNQSKKSIIRRLYPPKLQINEPIHGPAILPDIKHIARTP